MKRTKKRCSDSIPQAFRSVVVLAPVFHTSVYEFGEFDIVVDTTNNSADECATTIARALDMAPFPKAFDRLRHRSAPRSPD